MRTKATVFVLSCTYVAATLTAGGVAWGAPKASTLSKAVGPRIPTTGGQVHLTAYSDNDGPKYTVVLTGAIGDYGDAVRARAIGTSNKEYNLLEVTVTRGSFQLGIAKLESKLVRAIYGHFPTNTATCSGIVTASDAAPVVKGSGTGAYKGLRGTFDVNITINEVESWPSCPKTDTSPFLAQTVFLSGTGQVSLH